MFKMVVMASWLNVLIQGSLYHQLNQCTIRRGIPQMYHTFASFALLDHRLKPQNRGSETASSGSRYQVHNTQNLMRPDHLPLQNLCNQSNSKPKRGPQRVHRRENRTRRWRLKKAISFGDLWGSELAFFVGLKKPKDQTEAIVETHGNI